MATEMQGLVYRLKHIHGVGMSPEGENAMGSRWVLVKKSGAEGIIRKTKARPVAKGFIQREGVDYLQTSAPTPAATPGKTLTTEKGCKYNEGNVGLRGSREAPGGGGELFGEFVRPEKALYGPR